MDSYRPDGSWHNLIVSERPSQWSLTPFICLESVYLKIELLLKQYPRTRRHWILMGRREQQRMMESYQGSRVPGMKGRGLNVDSGHLPVSGWQTSGGKRNRLVSA